MKKALSLIMTVALMLGLLAAVPAGAEQNAKSAAVAINSRSRSSPCSAARRRWKPSNENGTVTTATVRSGRPRAVGPLRRPAHRVDQPVQLAQGEVRVGGLGERVEQLGGRLVRRGVRPGVPQPQPVRPEQVGGAGAVVREPVPGEPGGPGHHCPSSGRVRPVPAPVEARRETPSG